MQYYSDYNTVYHSPVEFRNMQKAWEALFTSSLVADIGTTQCATRSQRLAESRDSFFSGISSISPASSARRSSSFTAVSFLQRDEI